jgi:hypothetical protein
MFWIFTLALLFSGIIVFVDVIKKKSPQLGEVLGQIANYFGYVGIGLFILGVIALFNSLRVIGSSMSGFSILFIIAIFVGSIVAILLGALNGISVIKPFLASKSGVENLETKLLAFKLPLGIIAIVCSVYFLLTAIFSTGYRIAMGYWL